MTPAYALNQLLQQKLIEKSIEKAGLVVGHQQILGRLASDPVFQHNGQFSEQRLAQFAMQRGYTLSQVYQNLSNHFALLVTTPR